MTQKIPKLPSKVAALFREDWLREQKAPSGLSFDENAQRLNSFGAIVDQLYGQCESDAEKQLIWAELVLGLQTFNRHYDFQSDALQDLAAALFNRAYGLRGESSLDRCTKAKNQRSVEEEIHRARVMIAIEKYPKAKPTILKNAKKQFGWSQKQILKFIDNFEQDRIPSKGLKYFVDELRYQHDIGEIDLFNDLLR